MATDMDCLVLEEFVLNKEDQHPALRKDSEKYKSMYVPD
jgi:hypothetical protein